MNQPPGYDFHQTSPQLALDLIPFVPLEKDDVVLEPFRGEGSFFNAFPPFVNKEWTEISLGRPYTDHKDGCDWVITNPPFRLEGDHGRYNAVWILLQHFAPLVRKGIGFLMNDKCFSCLTPKRLHWMDSEHGLRIRKIIVCNVKQWRGRYRFVLWTKEKTDFSGVLLSSY